MPGNGQQIYSDADLRARKETQMSLSEEDVARVLGNAPVIQEEPPQSQEPAEPEGGQEPEAQESEVEPTGNEEPSMPEEEETTEKTIPMKAYMEEKRKRQELERQIQERQEPKSQPQTLEEYYDADPQGTINYLNNEISRLAEEDPYGNAAKIEQLRDRKIELRDYGQRKTLERSNQYNQNLNKIVPEFDKKREALTEYAVKELGYSMEELGAVTNPMLVGEKAALNTIKLINKQYEAANAHKTLPKKEQPTQPTKVEPPGEGIPAKTVNEKALFEEAKKTGDWTSYLLKSGRVPQ